MRGTLLRKSALPVGLLASGQGQTGEARTGRLAMAGVQRLQNVKHSRTNRILKGLLVAGLLVAVLTGGPAIRPRQLERHGQPRFRQATIGPEVVQLLVFETPSHRKVGTVLEFPEGVAARTWQSRPSQLQRSSAGATWWRPSQHPPLHPPAPRLRCTVGAPMHRRLVAIRRYLLQVGWGWA